MDVIRDADANLQPLLDRSVAIIGYGNQGRAQALNLRDSGVRVSIGSIADAGAARARDDGFEVVDIGAACARADVLALLIPDEVQREVYARDIAPRLRRRPGARLRARLQHPLRPHSAAGDGRRHHGRAAHDRHQRAPQLRTRRRRPGLRRRGAGRLGRARADRSGLGEGRSARRAPACWRRPSRRRPSSTCSPSRGCGRSSCATCCCRTRCWSRPASRPRWSRSSSTARARRRRSSGRWRASASSSRCGCTRRPASTARCRAARACCPRRRASACARRCARSAPARFAAEWGAEQAGGYPHFDALRQAARAHDINRAEVLGREMLARSGLGDGD